MKAKKLRVEIKGEAGEVVASFSIPLNRCKDCGHETNVNKSGRCLTCQDTLDSKRG